MAPRKRRGRSSSTPTLQFAPHGSTSNSGATSSHSSPQASKSDHEILSAGVAGLSTEPLSSQLSSAPIQSIGVKIRSKPTRSVNPSITVTPDTSREVSVCVERTVNGIGDRRQENGEKESSRAQFLLDTYRDTTANPASQDEFTVAGVAVLLYEDMINWAITDVAVQFKHNIYLQAEAVRRDATLAAARAKHSVTSPAPKTVPRLLYSDKNVTVECSNCTSNVSASRYAQHMEKCLGRGGRMSSRAASARLRASAERAEKEAAADMEDHPVRRRRNSSADPSADTASAGGAAYSKRRKMSPVPSAASGAAPQAATVHVRAGLPPSGRTRASPP